MSEESTLGLTITISLMATLLGTLGFSLAFKDYIASLMAGLIIRRVKHIRPKRRIKILTTPIIKGDIIDIGPLRTTIEEVGDGERLPSVRTGRTVKVANFFLFSNPVLIYGDTIVDEVVAHFKDVPPKFEDLINNMRRAIEGEGHKVIEVGIYQRPDDLAVHGIFETNPSEVTDARSKILKHYLEACKQSQLC